MFFASSATGDTFCDFRFAFLCNELGLTLREKNFSLSEQSIFLKSLARMRRDYKILNRNNNDRFDFLVSIHLIKHILM